jgi:hypothetical protein
LVVSLYGSRQIRSLSRQDGRRFALLIAQLSPHVGKSFQNRALGVEQLVAKSGSAKITAQTQKRVLSQVHHFLSWTYHEGHSPKLDFSAVRVDQKGIVQYEGGLPRAVAEDRAAQEQGFDDAGHYWKALADYVVNRRLT